MGVLSAFLYNQKGNEGDSVSKKPTERCGHRLRAASGGQETIGNTPEPDSRTGFSHQLRVLIGGL